MNHGQPGKVIGENQSTRLALLLAPLAAESAASRAAIAAEKREVAWRKFRSLVSLFNIGRLTSISAALFTFFLIYHRSGALLAHQTLFISAGLAVIFLPILLASIIFGARLGLFGAAEFFCGLAYLPMGIIGGTTFRERSHQLLALIYSGVGRFDEAIKSMQRHDNSIDIFAPSNSSPWNERRRLPELLARIGQDQRGWQVLQKNLKGDRQAIEDLDCPQFRDQLQCDLISAGSILQMLDRRTEALPYLQEAAAIGDEPACSASAKILGLYAAGLFYFNQDLFQEAQSAFEACSAEVQRQRLQTANVLAGKAARSKEHSEIYARGQIYLGQCYLQNNQTEKVPAVLTTIKDENASEPPAADDSILAAILESDYWLSQNRADTALAILAGKLELLLHSDAKDDRLATLTAKKYQKALQAAGQQEDAERIGQAIEKRQILNSSAKAAEHSTAGDTLDADRITGLKLDAHGQLRLPNLKISRQTSNRSVLFFLVTIAYTIYLWCLHVNTYVSLAATLLCLLALRIAVGNLKKHISNRRARFFVEQTLKHNQSENVTLEIISTANSLTILKNCKIKAGPADCLGRDLDFHFSEDLLYTSGACRINKSSEVKARLHRHPQSGEVLAVETLGRVLIVQNRPGKKQKQIGSEKEARPREK
ncbi:MAG: hypothetical protein KGS72_15965 [Cyanobacteria bacterium REEB67]|nr:hypothetical protein [Cyanobacteria bacterium REEB67]